MRFIELVGVTGKRGTEGWRLGVEPLFVLQMFFLFDNFESTFYF